VYHFAIAVIAALLCLQSVVYHSEVHRNEIGIGLVLTIAIAVTLLASTRSTPRLARSSRFGLSLDAVWVFAAVLLLPFPLMLFAIMVARWVAGVVTAATAGASYRRSRLISYVSITGISGWVASVVHLAVNHLPRPGLRADSLEVVAVLAAAVTFAVLSNALTSIGYALYRSEHLRIKETATGFLVEVALLCHGGLIAWAWTVSPAMFLLGLPSLVLVQRALLHDLLERRANRDAKTGLAAHDWWKERAAHEIGQNRTGRQVGVLVLDMDHFKWVNDTHGHLDGDRVLREAAAVLEQLVRSGDLVGRFGGEEFVVLLPDIRLPQLLQVAERLRKGVERHVVPLPRGSVRLTVSVGGAVHPRDGDSVDALLARADENLYRAKRAGRNQVVIDT
jgi:diguanylate cyclase (GGDEF)-like protein